MHSPAARLAFSGVLLAAGVGLRLALVGMVKRLDTVRLHLPHWVSLQRKFTGSLDLLLTALLFHLALPVFDFAEKDESALQHIAAIVTIVAATWFLMQLADMGQKVTAEVLTKAVNQGPRLRQLKTQSQFGFKILALVIGLLGFATVLLSFDGARQIGASLLASAGVASVVVGFAAQKSLGNLIAGLQIAVTQPIRLDDVVVVEGEWGSVEEISLTHVVLKLWDLRRLILPITYFTEKPFQNWTRSSSEILGHFFIYVDYAQPVELVRQELKRLTAESPLWSGGCCLLHVTNATETALELRGLVSARSASDAFDLKCMLREQLAAFVAQEHPAGLPRRRSQIVPERAEELAAAEAAAVIIAPN